MCTFFFFAGEENLTMLSIVAGLVGIMGLAVVSVSATKAIMAFHKRRQQK